MKRLLSLSIVWLLIFQLSIPLIAQKVDLDTLAGKNWVKNLVKEELKKIGTTPTDPATPSLDPCKKAPTISKIYNESATGLTFQFDGVDVFGIAYEIKNASGSNVASGIVAPKFSIIPILYSSLPQGSYSLNIQGSTCKSVVNSKNFTIGSSSPVEPADPGIPALDPCKKGPIISKIYSVTSTGLTFQFDGKDVFGIEYEVKNSSGVRVSHGLLTPTSSILGINLPNVGKGSYTLAIQGSTCKSNIDTKEFSVDYVGGIPVVGDAPVTIAKGMPQHMNLVWEKVEGGYRVTDIADSTQRGYYKVLEKEKDGVQQEVLKPFVTRYQIGSQFVNVGLGTLKNYFIAGGAYTRIMKYKIRANLESLNHWTTGDPAESYYYSKTAAEGFIYNTSVAFHTFYDKGGSGDFVNPFPSNYDPTTGQVQWYDLNADFQLPKGHYFTMGVKPYHMRDVLKKGITHVSNYDLDWDEGLPYTKLIKFRDEGHSYNDVPNNIAIFNLKKVGENDYTNGWNRAWWPTGPLTDKQAIEAGNKTNVSDAIWIGQPDENEAWMGPGERMWLPFYETVRKRQKEKFEANGVPSLLCHNYYAKGGDQLNSGKGREYYKALLRMTPEQMPQTVYSPGASLSHTNLIVEGVYLNTPDTYSSHPLELIFRLKLFRQMGYNAGTFLFAVHEWKPNNKYEVSYPEGKFYLSNKLPLDPALFIAESFLTQVYGNIFLEWGNHSKTKAKTIPEEWAGGQWFPNGATEAQGGFQHFQKAGDDSYFGYSGSSDLSYFGQKLFAETYGPVEGGKDEYLPFRIDGGNWINPSDFDFIDAYHDHRGFVHSRTSNGKTAFFFLDVFADNNNHTIEVKLPSGSIWKGEVSGNGVHAKLL